MLHKGITMQNDSTNSQEYADEERNRIIADIKRDGIEKTWKNRRPSEMLVAVALLWAPRILITLGLILCVWVIVQFNFWAVGDLLESILSYSALKSQFTAMIIIASCLVLVSIILSTVHEPYKERKLYSWINSTGIDVPRFIIDISMSINVTPENNYSMQVMYRAELKKRNNLKVDWESIIVWVIAAALCIVAIWYTVFLHGALLSAMEETFISGKVKDSMWWLPPFMKNWADWVTWVILGVLFAIMIVAMIVFRMKSKTNSTGKKILEWAKEQIDKN